MFDSKNIIFYSIIFHYLTSILSSLEGIPFLFIFSIWQLELNFNNRFLITGLPCHPLNIAGVIFDRMK